MKGGVFLGRTKENIIIVPISMCNTLFKLTVVTGLLLSNMLALYSFYITQETIRSFGTSNQELNLQSDSPTIRNFVQELYSLQDELRVSRRDLTQIRVELQSSLEELRSHEELRQRFRNVSQPGEHLQSMLQNAEGISKLSSTELERYVAVRELPLGTSSLLGVKTLVSPIGHACFNLNTSKLLEQYMTYNVGNMCPDDWSLAQRLMLNGCEPLPRRRCFAQTPTNISNPRPFPESLWMEPLDETIRWTLYKCKSFECLNNRKAKKMAADCIDCFDLSGLERQRWVTKKGRHDFLVEQVVRMKNGTIRVGLDLGGGGGSFAARMRELNVTIVTTTLNLGGPFSEFVALRGLPPLFITVSQRLPFFDNTLDMVHSMHVLSDWLPRMTLEFLLYDIDRVLRPGGLLWIDRFFCSDRLLGGVYIPLLENLGYLKLRWVTGTKNDKRGYERKQVYLTALLEKPFR